MISRKTLHRTLRPSGTFDLDESPPACQTSCLTAARGRSPMYEHWTQRSVEFADTDLGGHIHFSRYLVFMETAEHEFLNAAGLSVSAIVDGEHLSWPRLSTGCEFLHPVGFEDRLDIRVFVLRKGGKSLTFGCEFFHEGALVARGQMSSACCILRPEEPLESVAIPATLAARIDEVPDEEKKAWQLPIRPL